MNTINLIFNDSKLTATQRLVLMRVALRATGTEGSCWESVATVATACSLSERTVRSTLRDLEAAGWVVASPEHGRSTVYRVQIPTPGADPAAGGGGSCCRGGRILLPGGADPAAPDQGSDQEVDQEVDQGTSPSAPALPVKPEKNNSSRGNKNKNPITEAWAEAWKKQTNGKAYPWSGSFHRAVAMARDVDPQPHELLVEDMGRYLRTARELSLEGWIRATVQAQRRAALGRQHETVDDLLGLLPPIEFSPPPTPPPTPAPTTTARRLSAKEEIEAAREAQRQKAFGGAR